MKNNISLYFSNSRNVLLLIIFLALLFSIFYSEDKKAAMKGILTALPLLSIPLAMTTVNNLPSWQINILKKVFVVSCLITSLIYFVQTGIRIGLFDGSYRFKPLSSAYHSSYLVYNLTYHQLTPSIHAVFFSLYIAFAVLILLFDTEWKNVLPVKILQVLIIVYFLLYLIMLTSATMNFALYSFIIASVFFRASFKKLFHYILFFGLIIAGTAITDYLLIVKYIGPDIGDIIYRFDSPSINQKIIISYVIVIIAGAAAIIIKLSAKKNYKTILFISFLIATLAGLLYLKKSIDKNSSDWKLNNISVRASYGSEAIRIIKQNPLLGVGIGDKKYKLIDRNIALGDNRYVEFGASTKPDDIFNPHNQFLDFWIAAGILPVICLILFFIDQFSKALRYKNILYLGLLYCFCLFCFTDVAMMVQRGQIFFLFFICLLEMESRKKMLSSSLTRVKNSPLRRINIFPFINKKPQ